MHEESILIPYPLPPLRLKFAMHSFTTFFMHKYVFLYTHSIELIIWFFCLLLLFCICNNVCGKTNRFVQWIIQILSWICLVMSQLGPGFSSSPNKGCYAKSSFLPKASTWQAAGILTPSYSVSDYISKLRLFSPSFEVTFRLISHKMRAAGWWVTFL